MKPPSKPTKNIDSYYELIETGTSEEENWTVRIKKGQFKGIQYRYGKVSVKDMGDHALTSFTFDMVEVPKKLQRNLTRKEAEALEVLMGDIVIDLLQRYYEETYGTGKDQ